VEQMDLIIDLYIYLNPDLLCFCSFISLYFLQLHCNKFHQFYCCLSKRGKTTVSVL